MTILRGTTMAAAACWARSGQGRHPGLLDRGRFAGPGGQEPQAGLGDLGRRRAELAAHLADIERKKASSSQSALKREQTQNRMAIALGAFAFLLGAGWPLAVRQGVFDDRPAPLRLRSLRPAARYTWAILDGHGVPVEVRVSRSRR